MKIKRYIVDLVDDGSLAFQLAEKELFMNWNADEVEGEECEDCVSRKEVEKLKKYRLSYDTNTTVPKTDIFVKIADIKELPSVTPQPKTIQEKQAESEKYEKAFDEGYENGYAQARFDYEQQPSEDCISRQAVIDYAKDTCLDLDKYEDTEVFCDEIKAMPPVTPTSKDIKEAYLKGYDYGVKDWFKSKTQPCEDCISREEVRIILSNEVFELMKLHTVNPEDNPKADAMAYGVNWSLNTLMELPSVYPERPNPDVVEKMKKVIDEMTEIHSDGEFYIKNVDAKWIINKYLYGAEMIGGGEDEVSN